MGSASSSQSKVASGSGAPGVKGGAAGAAPSSVAPRAKGAAASKDCGNCDHCKFMKAGGCRELYVKALDCIKEARESDVQDPGEHCSHAAEEMYRCMDVNWDYYRHRSISRPPSYDDFDGAEEI